MSPKGFIKRALYVAQLVRKGVIQSLLVPLANYSERSNLKWSSKTGHHFIVNPVLLFFLIRAHTCIVPVRP